MKYSVYNASLDFLKVQYGVNSVSDLEDKVRSSDITGEQLIDICYKTDAPIIYDTRVNSDSKRSDTLNNIIGRKNLTKTLDALIEHNSYSDYMDKAMLEDSQVRMLNDMDVLKNMREAKSGDSTFRQMAQMKLGIFKLRPFATAQLEVAKEWMEGSFMKKPYASRMIITGEDGTIYKYVKPIEVVVNALNYVKLTNLCEKLGIKKEPAWGIDLVRKEVIKQAKGVMTTEEFEEFIKEEPSKEIESMTYQEKVAKAAELGFKGAGMKADKLSEEILARMNK